MLIRELRQNGFVKPQHRCGKIMGALIGNGVQHITIDFPITANKLAAVFHVLNVRDQKALRGLYIGAFESDVIPGLKDVMSVYDGDRLDEINFLACEIAAMNESDRKKLAVILENEPEFYDGLHRLINLTENLNNYVYIPGAFTVEDVGMYFFRDELERAGIKTSDYEPHFNAWEYGQYVAWDEDFIVGGYLSEMDAPDLIYRGIIPRGWRVSVYALRTACDTLAHIRRKHMVCKCGEAISAAWTRLKGV